MKAIATEPALPHTRFPLTSAASRRAPSREASQDELAALFARWQQHRDQRAREQLVVMFLPLARRLARRYLGAGEPVDDLVQVASFALVKAIDRFDPARGLAFSSFAVPTILGELRRYFRDTGWSVHVPRGAQEKAIRIDKATREFSARAGRSPSPQELAQLLEWELSEVLDALEANGAHHAGSLDAPCGGDSEDDVSLVDMLGSEDDRFEIIDELTSITGAMRHLDDRQREIIRLRFEEDLTQSQIAELMGVSQMHISRVLRAALAQLRNLVAPDAA